MRQLVVRWQLQTSRRRAASAYMEGMTAARVNWHDLARIQSVALLFVSCMDTEVDRRLEAIGSREALALRGTAAIANARCAFSVYTEALHRAGLLELAGHGAAKQRPL
jgi:transaldolase